MICLLSVHSTSCSHLYTNDKLRYFLLMLIKFSHTEMMVLFSFVQLSDIERDDCVV